MRVLLEGVADASYRLSLQLYLVDVTGAPIETRGLFRQSADESREMGKEDVREVRFWQKELVWNFTQFKIDDA